MNCPSCNKVVPLFNQDDVFANVIIKDKTGFNSTYIWDGNTPGDCITNVAYYRSGAQTEAAIMKPTGVPNWFYQNLEVYNYSITKEINSAGVAHHLHVTYGAFVSHPI